MKHTLLRNSILSLVFLGASISLMAQSFTDVTIGAGITDPDNTKLTHDGAGATDIMGVGSGAAWIDYDQDGNLDLYISMRTGANKLYQSNGDGTFTNVANAMEVENSLGDGAGVVVGDINNDGWPDIFVNNCNQNKLYRNNGGTSFTDITVSSGLDGILGNRRGTSATFGDYDGDGFLDLFVAHHFMTNGTQAEADRKDFLIRNDGDETFTDASSLLVTNDLIGFGFIGGWTDYDQDGDQDIILINDCESLVPQFNFPTKVFRNDGGTDPINNWTFTEVGDIIGIDDCRNGMGIAVGDYDRNGWLDIFYTNIGEVVLFKNEDGLFTDVTSGTGLDIQNTLDYSWGCTFVDYDLDGWQDLYVTLGELNPMDMDDRANQMFKNDGDGTFSEVASSLGINDQQKSRNAVFGDYDNDGDLDFFLVNYSGECSLFRNDVPAASNHYLVVKPQGTISNRDGIGAKVTIVYGDPAIHQIFEVRSGSNLGGGEEIGAFFGLGTETMIDSVIVDFLSGEQEVVLNVAADQRIIVIEPEAGLPIELSSFEVTKKNNTSVLEWATLSEINNRHFEIQRSANGITFEKVGEVEGQGTTTELVAYSFVDLRPLNGTNYYRLLQVDLDGTSTLSSVRIVNFTLDNEPLKVIPNPVRQGVFELTYNGDEAEVNYELFDLLGNRILQNKIQNTATVSIGVETLPNGIYILQVSGKLTQHTEKVMINK